MYASAIPGRREHKKINNNRTQGNITLNMKEDFLMFFDIRNPDNCLIILYSIIKLNGKCTKNRKINLWINEKYLILRPEIESYKSVKYYEKGHSSVGLSYSGIQGHVKRDVIFNPFNGADKRNN
jgi:hypothetical protein